ncbi:MAG: four helix bundle protein, partial [Candidatus Margulisbacteria bacterium]|nr:four helix bundle protein [Candidatus Margulisiibacteriota bacterium]
DYKDLKVWQKSFLLTKDIYKLCTNLPKEENYGLKSQIQRAVLSIPSNIAEGQARKGSKEFVQFLYIAKGSLAEVETLLLLGGELSYFKAEDVNKLTNDITECNKMLSKLISVISKK